MLRDSTDAVPGASAPGLASWSAAGSPTAGMVATGETTAGSPTAGMVAAGETTAGDTTAGMVAVRETTARGAAAGGAVRVPAELREVARFPGVADGPRDAVVWARVLVVAAKQLATAAREAGSWPQEAQGQVVAAHDEVGRLATVAKAPVLAAQEAGGAWRGAGVRSFEDFRARKTRTGRGPARREVTAARTLQELDGGLEAMESGVLTPVHAERLGSLTGKLPEEHKHALLTGPGAQRVKRLAERLDPAQFAKKVEDMAAELSAKQVEDTHQRARARRHLELSPTPDGMTRIAGLLDPVAGHTLQIALDAAAARPAADDERTRGQRQADALQSLAEAMLTEQKTTGHSRPHILITMTAQTFQSARDHLARCGQAPSSVVGETTGAAGGIRNGDEARQSLGLGPSPVVRMQDGPLLPLSEIGRTLCDSQIARLVIGADSEPIDLGRSQRLFTPAQRRAVIARDGGCAWDGCTTPARYGEVHHLDWWDDDHGHTDIDRAVLLCVFHHHELHRHHLDLIRDPDPPPETATRQLDPPDARDLAPPAISAGEPPGDVSTNGPAQSPPPRDPDLPGDPERRRPRYRAVPRAQTRAAREAATRERLLADARASAQDDEPEVTCASSGRPRLSRARPTRRTCATSGRPRPSRARPTRRTCASSGRPRPSRARPDRRTCRRGRAGQRAHRRGRDLRRGRGPRRERNVPRWRARSRRRSTIGGRT